MDLNHVVWVLIGVVFVLGTWAVVAGIIEERKGPPK